MNNLNLERRMTKGISFRCTQIFSESTAFIQRYVSGFNFLVIVYYLVYKPLGTGTVSGSW